MAPYNHYAVFPREPAEPVFFSGGSNSARTPSARGWVNDLRPVRQPREGIRQEVRRFKGSGGVGLVQIDSVAIPIYPDLVEDFGVGAIRDATDLFRKARWEKSEEEIECCRKSAQVADAGYLLIKDILRSGITDGEVYGQLRHLIHARGCEYSMEMIGFGAENPPDFTYSPIGNVMSDAGWIGIEITPAYQGYFTQLYASIPASRPTVDQQKLIDAWARAKEAAISALKPGARACDVYFAAEKVLHSQGYQATGPAGHSLGLDVHEVLSLQPDHQTVLEPGMIIVVHVMLAEPQTGVNYMAGTTFLVTRDGNESPNQVRLI
ncbi:MAG: M24 family metallopeptidase [Chloroflexi bacterium]|nr:M24 family metallopeptidase [Chloroflexota bacterium]